MSTFFLLLDSFYSNISFGNDRNASDVSYLINLSLHFDYYTVNLDSISIPNVEPAVRTGVNDRLVFRENGNNIDFTAVLPEGNYNGTQYASSLQTAMNSVIGIANTYTVSYNPITLKFTIQTTIPNTFSLRSNSTMLNELGFSSSQLNTFSTGKTADWTCDISGSHYIDIVSNFNTKTTGSGLNGRGNILARIQLDVPKGNIVYWKKSVDSNSIVVKRIDLEQLEFKIYNDKGQIFDIDPNQKICLNLSITPYK